MPLSIYIKTSPSLFSNIGNSRSGFAVIQGGETRKRATPIGAAAAPTPVNTQSNRKVNGGFDSTVNLVPVGASSVWGKGGESSKDEKEDTTQVKETRMVKAAPWANQQAINKELAVPLGTTLRPANNNNSYTTSNTTSNAGANSIPPPPGGGTPTSPGIRGKNWADMSDDEDDDDDTPQTQRGGNSNANNDNNTSMDAGRGPPQERYPHHNNGPPTAPGQMPPGQDWRTQDRYREGAPQHQYDSRMDPREQYDRGYDQGPHRRHPQGGPMGGMGRPMGPPGGMRGGPGGYHDGPYGRDPRDFDGYDNWPPRRGGGDARGYGPSGGYGPPQDAGPLPEDMSEEAAIERSRREIEQLKLVKAKKLLRDEEDRKEAEMRVHESERLQHEAQRLEHQREMERRRDEKVLKIAERPDDFDPRLHRSGHTGDNHNNLADKYSRDARDFRHMDDTPPREMGGGRRPGPRGNGPPVGPVGSGGPGGGRDRGFSGGSDDMHAEYQDTDGRDPHRDVRDGRDGRDYDDSYEDRPAARLLFDPKSGKMVEAGELQTTPQKSNNRNRNDRSERGGGERRGPPSSRDGYDNQHEKGVKSSPNKILTRQPGTDNGKQSSKGKRASDETNSRRRKGAVGDASNYDGEDSDDHVTDYKKKNDRNSMDKRGGKAQTSHDTDGNATSNGSKKGAKQLKEEEKRKAKKEAIRKIKEDKKQARAREQATSALNPFASGLMDPAVPSDLNLDSIDMDRLSTAALIGSMSNSRLQEFDLSITDNMLSREVNLSLLNALDTVSNSNAGTDQNGGGDIIDTHIDLDLFGATDCIDDDDDLGSYPLLPAGTLETVVETLAVNEEKSSAGRGKGRGRGGRGGGRGKGGRGRGRGGRGKGPPATT